MSLVTQINDEICRISVRLDCDMFLSDKERDRLLVKINDLTTKKENYIRIIYQDQKDK